MRLSVDHWIATQKPSGFLLYGFDFLADRESEPDSMSPVNLTRQAGAASTLADWYALTGDERARAPLEKMLAAMGRHSLPIGKSPVQQVLERTRLLSLPVGRYKLRAALTRFGLLYRPEGSGRVLSPGRDYADAYAGATALALLAEVRYAQASRDVGFAGLRHAWLEALVGLRMPGSGFRQTVISIDHDAYFDGEAWLALAEYHRAFPTDATTAATLSAVDDDLLRLYGASFRLAFFHWGTMAASARYRDTRAPKFLEFVRMQMREFLGYKLNETNDHNTCALAEGVADGLAALALGGEGNGALAAKARTWLVREMAKAEALQVRPHQEGLRFANARVEAPRMKAFAGSFLAGTHLPTTQVDLAQHCVSAMIKIRRNELLPSGS
jgi:hypothetical protein